MSKTAILYGPILGSVAKAAKVVATELPHAQLIAVKDASIDTILEFDHIVMGISTIGRANWDSSHSDNDWDLFMARIEKMDWTGKTVAMFGLGDHLTYPENFVDALGWLYDKLAKQQAKIVGDTSPDGYDFTESAALRNGLFVGLPLDEDCEPELTLPRIQKWVAQLTNEGF
jgi:flavodoxin I